MFVIRDLDGNYYSAETHSFGGRKAATCYATEQDCPLRICKVLYKGGFAYYNTSRGRIKWAEIERDI